MDVIMPCSPFQRIERRAFWRIAVEKRSELAPTDIFKPRFQLRENMQIATAGSCFAQHVGRALKESGFRVIDAEPAPHGVPDSVAKDFGYATFSARYGNIYTSAHLLQILKEALGLFEPAEPVWRLKNRFVDSQRPSVEPSGLERSEDVIWHRVRHLSCFLKMMRSCDLFIFTFGLTEAWLHSETQTVFSMAPGILGGNYDPKIYTFRNYTTHDVISDFQEFRKLAQTLNPDMKFLITVSPVPLAATASGKHVEVATSRSKAVLRAACDELTSTFVDVDYFPSYEIITSPRVRGQFFSPNLRDVTSEGVHAVIAILKLAYGIEKDETIIDPSKIPSAIADEEEDTLDTRCEEVLLNNFADSAGENLA